MKKKVIVLIEARMNSTRLPGKVIKNLGHDSVIGVLLERVKQIKNINKFVVITTKDKADNKIIDIIKKKKVFYFRGSEANVFDRILKASEYFKADVVVRLTADNPLVDPEMIDLMIKYFLKKPNLTYLTNGYKSDFVTRQLPFGLDIELLNPVVLRKFSNQVKSKKLKEYPTLVLFNNKKKIKLKTYRVKNIKFHPNTRLTIDTIKDLKMMNKLYCLLYEKYQNKFNLKRIYNVLNNNKWLLKINGKIKQKKI